MLMACYNVHALTHNGFVFAEEVLFAVLDDANENGIEEFEECDRPYGLKSLYRTSLGRELHARRKTYYLHHAQYLANLRQRSQSCQSIASPPSHVALSAPPFS